MNKKLCGGQIWSAGYFVSTVGKYANEKQIENYVRNQGKNYERLYRWHLSFLNRTNENLVACREVVCSPTVKLGIIELI